MVNIVISQNGNVTGDKGKIIAYEGQKYSEVLNIVHPLIDGAKYYIEYKYADTILRNELDSNNNVSIQVFDAGYVQCKFVAIDLLSGDIVFKSKTWNLIVKQDLKIVEYLSNYLTIYWDEFQTKYDEIYNNIVKYKQINILYNNKNIIILVAL